MAIVKANDGDSAIEVQIRLRTTAHTRDESRRMALHAADQIARAIQDIQYTRFLPHNTTIKV